jgi:hypothetical protein
LLEDRVLEQGVGSPVLPTQVQEGGVGCQAEGLFAKAKMSLVHGITTPEGHGSVVGYDWRRDRLRQELRVQFPGADPPASAVPAGRAENTRSSVTLLDDP